MRLTIIALAMLCAEAAHGEGANAKGVERVDSVLDRLEKRLLDQEGDQFSFGESFPAEAEEKPSAQYQYKNPGKVEGTTSSQQSLKEVANAIAALEAEIDQLAGSVQKTKQGILSEAGVDNFVAIEAEVADTDKLAIRSLTVKLDGYKLYEISEASGLWLPSKLLPLYAGPLSPGNHRVDFEARLVLRENKSVPVNGDVYRFVNKVFDVSIPRGTLNSRYVIAVRPPDKDGSADATMKEVK